MQITFSAFDNHLLPCAYYSSMTGKLVTIPSYNRAFTPRKQNCIYFMSSISCIIFCQLRHPKSAFNILIYLLFNWKRQPTQNFATSICLLLSKSMKQPHYLILTPAVEGGGYGGSLCASGVPEDIIINIPTTWHQVAVSLISSLEQEERREHNSSNNNNSSSSSSSGRGVGGGGEGVLLERHQRPSVAAAS